MTSLGLGTVQLGLPYGNNSQGSIMPFATAFEALQIAVSGGIRFFDTAKAYGESEARLGQANLASWRKDIEISTKIPQVSPELWLNESQYMDFLAKSCQESCQQLKVQKLGLLQFHQCQVPFLASASVARNMGRLIADGFCTHIGVSVYEPEQAYAALSIPYVSSLQIPLNIIDQRFASEDLQALYRSKQARIIARSIFLQGILIGSANLPAVARKADLARLREMYVQSIVPYYDTSLALSFVLKNCKNFVDVALIGVDSLESLRANLSAAAAIDTAVPNSVLDALENARHFAEEREILNPAIWNVPPKNEGSR